MAKKQKRIEEVLLMSLKVFAEFGFKKATMEDIARELDMTKGALYVYVRDKKDLYEQSVSFAMTEWQNRVKEAVEKEENVEKQFTVMCYKALQYLSEDNNLRKILVKNPDIFPIQSQHDPYYEINNNSRRLLQSILERGIRENRFRNVDTGMVTEIMFSIYKMFIVESYVFDQSQSHQKMFDELIRLVTNGLFNTPKGV
jgi:Transcriptional regulator